MNKNETDTKFVKVPANGQISIGKGWAGRQVKIEQVNSSEIHISAGVFIPHAHSSFYSKKALERLRNFGDWAESHPPRKTDLRALRTKLAKKA